MLTSEMHRAQNLSLLAWYAEMPAGPADDMSADSDRQAVGVGDWHSLVPACLALWNGGTTHIRTSIVNHMQQDGNSYALYGYDQLGKSFTSIDEHATCNN